MRFRTEHIFGGSVVAMISGALASLYGLWVFGSTFELRFWQEAPGVVTSARGWSEQVPSLERYDQRYFMQIRYEYDALGTVYEGWRINHGFRTWEDRPGGICQSTSDGDEYALVLAHYRRGAKIWALFDPDDPRDAVLEDEMLFWDWLALVGGPLLFAAGLLVFRYGDRFV
ncbi:MAG: DUF3592 domain-containing protein [Deltaproteobacteria bacterium]|nr:DUF3592 domain-containing protein [Deltaproteobacteria bacterium]